MAQAEWSVHAMENLYQNALNAAAIEPNAESPMIDHVTALSGMLYISLISYRLNPETKPLLGEVIKERTDFFTTDSNWKGVEVKLRNQLKRRANSLIDSGALETFSAELADELRSLLLGVFSNINESFLARLKEVDGSVWDENLLTLSIANSALHSWCKVIIDTVRLSSPQQYAKWYPIWRKYIALSDEKFNLEEPAPETSTPPPGTVEKPPPPTAETFADFLGDNAVRLLPFLVKEFTGKKPRYFAYLLFALSDLGLMILHVNNANQTHLHAALSQTFGHVGTRENLNINISNLRGATEAQQMEILKIKELINRYLEG